MTYQKLSQHQATYNITEDVLPQVAQKLEHDRSRRYSTASTSATVRPQNGIFQKRCRMDPISPPGQISYHIGISQGMQGQGQNKRRRNTICTSMPRYEILRNTLLARNPPNDVYPVSACQDVAKVTFNVTISVKYRSPIIAIT